MKVTNAMRRPKGFSLIELLIVVAIILVIAAIAIPNLMRSRMSANEASAVGSIRQIKSAEVAYSSLFGSTGYAAALVDLGCNGLCPTPPTPGQSGFIDDSLALASAGRPHSGYTFAATGIPVGTLNGDYVVGAVPATAGTTGGRDFCSTSEGSILFQVSTGAPPVNSVAGCNFLMPLQ